MTYLIGKNGRDKAAREGDNSTPGMCLERLRHSHKPILELLECELGKKSPTH